MAVFTARQIAATVQGQLEGNEAVQIDNASGLEEATDRDISFFHNAKYLKSLKQTRAGVVFIPEKTDGLPLPAGRTFIRVKNPQWAFAQALTLLKLDRQKHPRGISAQAAVDPSAQIGDGTAIGPFVTVESGAVIGKNVVIYAGVYIGADCRVGDQTILYPNVVLREETQVGARVIIHAGTVVGTDGYGFATVQGRQYKIPQVGIVVIEDDVEIGGNVAIDRATTGETRIGAGTKIDNLVQIAHNVQIGRDCLIVGQAGIAGSTKVGDRVTMAGQVGVVGHITIGHDAVLAAQSGIMNDVEPGAVVFGSPSRPYRETMRLEAIFGKLPEIYSAFKAVKRKISTEA
jgi:UDP-3-O-[3-hydroxymyristoyl] glucosamine N-acyltransferase